MTACASAWARLSDMLIVTAVFSLVDGASEEEFLAADARFQEDFAYQLKGHLRRTTARGDNGTWIVISWFDSAESFAAAGNATEGLDAVEEMHRFIDFSTHRVETFTTL